MRLFDYVRLAIKNLTRQRARTILTVIAITVGSFSLILMASIIISIRQSLINQFQQLGAFDLVTVVKDPNSVDDSRLISSTGDPSDGKKMDDTTLATIKSLPHVYKATPTGSVNVGTMKLEGQTKKTWANITAFDPSNDVFGSSIIAGRRLTNEDMDKIVVGSQFISEIEYSGKAQDLIGKKVILSMKMGGVNAPDWGPLPIKPPEDADENWYKSQQNKSTDIEAEIVGVSASSNVDGGGSYITMSWARRLMTNVSWQYPKEQPKDQCAQDEGIKGQNTSCVHVQPQMQIVKTDMFADQGYSAIVIKVDSQDNLSAVENEVKALGYGTNTAQKMLDKINQILVMISIVLAAIGGISLFVAAIGIINTMIMAAYERTREIGVMRACGATKGTIRRLFTFEAAILGFLGGLFGMTLSYVIVTVVRIIIQKNELMLGDLPITEIGNFPWWLIVSVLAFTTLIGILAGLYPARRAAKMNPIDALRYE
jgi:ABC-type antimicrobial peptide transport system permease subunit